mmetsp:Transcript_520/g.1438  ORF Transcript_520/g.1438 Transcript_520/m.1438 type:complete len:107 (-) Transcript_520:523-843(-)
MRWVFLIALALASASAFTAPAPIARPLTRNKHSREVLSKFLASPSKLWLDLMAGIQQLYPLARAVTKFGDQAVEVGNRAVNRATIVTLFSVIFFGAIKVYEIQQRA